MQALKHGTDNHQLSTEVNRAVTNLFTAQNLLNPDATGRSEIGIVLQNPAVRPWRRSVVWALTQRLAAHWDGQGEWSVNAEAEWKKWEAFVDKIGDLGLDEAIDRPLLLDVSRSHIIHPGTLAACIAAGLMGLIRQGKSLQSLLAIKPSPLLMVILRAVNVWRLDHPSGTKEECEAWVKDMWEGHGRQEWEKAVPPIVPKGKAKERDIGEKRKR